MGVGEDDASICECQDTNTVDESDVAVQGYLAHKKLQPP